MASVFSALALPAGEAFLLETIHRGQQFSILVDSGSSSAVEPDGNGHALVTAIRRAAPKLRRIDIAVCTHQDSDHANGFRTFPDVWCSEVGEIGEFWLPGRWSTAMPDLLIDTHRALSRLWIGALTAAERLGSEQLQGAAFEDRLRAIARESEREKAPQRGLGQNSDYNNTEQIKGETRLARALGLDIEALRGLEAAFEESGCAPSELIDKAACWEQAPFPWFWEDYLHTGNPRSRLFGRHGISLFRDALETAKSIAAIAECAVRWRIPIRWFDFGPFEKGSDASGGIEGLLEPVNSVELHCPPRDVPQELLFYALRLSRQNVESLVFHRPENDHEPAVLFLGDSRLSFGITKPSGEFPMPMRPPSKVPLVTAPHHGSRVNDLAYSIIRKWIGSSEDGGQPIYVRNGGHWKQVLNEFLDQPRRYCVNCSRTCRRNDTRISVRSSIIAKTDKGGMWQVSRAANRKRCC